MSFAVGSLVKARGREWVVLPESDEQLLVVRPLGGTDAEIAGIYLPLEKVEQARFDLPDPSLVGDYLSARLLRDAIRLGFRSSAGPFRSFARLAFEPRPYQLVPLLMALKLDPVRMLISDDVGIGKTVEAGLIARELLDRGEVDRLAVLCPPQLAEQWQAELRDKFHIDAELVLPGTISRLEKNTGGFDRSIFEVYPYTIVSLDYIKSDRRRDEFKRTCPELVIIDEAHTCAYAEGRGRHQRHQLVSGLAENPDRHMVLVTATPHSGKEDAFRSLLTLLDPDFANLPDDLTGPDNERHRRRLAAHFIQRRRADIRHYMDANTPFPEREEGEDTYKLSPEYKKLFERVLEYARETVRDVKDTSKNQFQQRVRWWSALALLRSLASSPAAAAATLRNRAATVDAETPQEADEIGKRTILDMVEDEAAEGMDVAPGSDFGGEEDEAVSNRRRLLEMARLADALSGEKDEKLNKAVKLVSSLLKDGYRPILFCRFIPTADYVADALRKSLKGVEVASVSGTLPPDERELRVNQLKGSEKRVLVCTDCLSEGINLQEGFDAVIHYDLSWNPTRHEQREGRVDRFGQKTPRVRVLTYYGVDNQIDGIVLDVLLRKHRTIRSSLGISVPVPVDTEKVVEAIFEGLLLKSKPSAIDNYLPGFEEYMRPTREDLYGKWDAVTEREKRSRTLFAQETIKVEEVSQELQAAQDAVGSGVDVESFTRHAFQMVGASLREGEVVQVDARETPQGLKDLFLQSLGPSFEPEFTVSFDLADRDSDYYLTRTHPLIESLSSYVLESALDPLNGKEIRNPARRCGVIRTKAVDKRTALLLLRFRYHIIKEKKGEENKPLLAEECGVLAFTGSPQNAEWLSREDTEKLLQVSPDANVNPDQARESVQKVIDSFDSLHLHLDGVATELGNQLLDAHQRVRIASKQKGLQTHVEPNLPPDVLGIYVFLPKPP
jgi:superfamily II DNA or RNA helicase